MSRVQQVPGSVILGHAACGVNYVATSVWLERIHTAQLWQFPRGVADEYTF